MLNNITFTYALNICLCQMSQLVIMTQIMKCNFGLIVSQKYKHEIDPYVNNVKTSRPAFCLLRWNLTDQRHILGWSAIKVSWLLANLILLLISVTSRGLRMSNSWYYNLLDIFRTKYTRWVLGSWLYISLSYHMRHHWKNYVGI